MKRFLYCCSLVAASFIFHSSFSQGVASPEGVASSQGVISSRGVAGGDNPVFRHLPPDANMVIHVDLPVLLSKISLEDLAGSLSRAAHQDLHSLLSDPAQTGIDLHQDIFFANARKASGPISEYGSIILHLADSGKFIAFLRKQEPGLRILHLPGKGRTAGKDKVAITWNAQLAVITLVKSREPVSHKPAAGAATMPSYLTLAAKRNLAVLQGFDNTFYTTNTLFKNGFSDGGDVHIWSSEGNPLAGLSRDILRKAGPIGRFSSMAQPKGMSLNTIAFGAGKFSLRTIAPVPPDTAAVYQALNSRPLNMALVAHLPGRLLGLANMHFDPSLLSALLDKFRFREKLDSGLAAKGITSDDIIKTIQGDFLFAAVAPAALQTEASESASKKMPDLYFVMTINDPQSLQKINQALKILNEPAAAGSDSGSAANSGGMLGKMKTGYALKDNILVISRTKELADSYFSAGRQNTDFITERMVRNPFSVTVDVGATADFLHAISPAPSEKDEKTFEILKQIERFTLTAGRLEGNQVESYLEMTMTDKSENSLHAILKLLPH